MRTKPWSTNCWPHPIMPKEWRCGGWTVRATVTRTDFRRTLLGRTGRGETGSSRLSTKTCLLTSSRLNSLRVTCCRMRPMNKDWRRAFIETICTMVRVGVILLSREWIMSVIEPIQRVRSDRFNNISPISYAFTKAQKLNVPWVILLFRKGIYF